MAFIPTDPTRYETIGSFTLNINGFVVRGNVQYQPPFVNEQYGAIFAEIYGNRDIKEAAAEVLGLTVDEIAIEGYGSGETGGIIIKDGAGR